MRRELITYMMTSSNGDIFRVTGHLSGKFTCPGEFPTQRPVTRSFDVFFDLCLNKRLSKQSSGWWFETLSRPLWRHRNEKITNRVHIFVKVLFVLSVHTFSWTPITEPYDLKPQFNRFIYIKFISTYCHKGCEASSISGIRISLQIFWKLYIYIYTCV